MVIVAQGRLLRRQLILASLPIFLIMALFYYMTAMPGSSYSGPLRPLEREETEIKERLQKQVDVLAGTIGERNLRRYDKLQAAERYIEETFREAGHNVARHQFMVGEKVVNNIEVKITGHSLPEEIVVVGAHYDTVFGSPGANDNATGTAAVLELGRLLAGQKLPRTVRLVAFVNEELPFFGSDQMGSRVYARRSRMRGENIIAMLSIETIGYYSDEKGSQQYPSPFSLFYPDTANFIGFVANLSSRSLVRRSIASFRRHSAFPSEGVAAPGWMTGIGWSDHWSFWEEGYDAIMITDTALFRYGPYHSSADTPDKIDYDRTARVVAGIARVVTELAGSDADEDIRDG